MACEIYLNAQEVAERAAEDLVQSLRRSIETRGKAVWGLAGGSSPMLAYKLLAEKYSEQVDWSKVTILIGDERCVSLDDPASNWGQISKILFVNSVISHAKQLVPRPELGPEKAAQSYSQLLEASLASRAGQPVIDVLWIGVGEDGHTLSLFPDHPALFDDSQAVIPIDDSPKPPGERISLSFKAATTARKLVVFAVGESKRKALLEKDSLPIGQITNQAKSSGAEVLWLCDQAAVEV